MKHWFLRCVMLILLAACAPAAKQNNPTTAHSSQAAAPPAKRIVALAPNLTELVFAAGAGGSLVATVEYANYPAAAQALPHVGDAFHVDLEHLLALKPDLVLTWPSGMPPAVLDQIRSLGLRVESIEVQRIAEVGTTLRLIGKLTGTEAAAEQAAQQFEMGVATLRERYAQHTPLRVFIEVNRQPLYTVNRKQIISEVVELCGGQNVFADLNQLAPIIGIEAVLQANPEVILATDGSPAQLTQDWRVWPQLAAIRKHHLYAVLPDTATRATTRLLQGITDVCDALQAARQ